MVNIWCFKYIGSGQSRTGSATLPISQLMEYINLIYIGHLDFGYIHVSVWFWARGVVRIISRLQAYTSQFNPGLYYSEIR